ncbi:MAG TPA: hypothetical protein VLV15_06340, partial [Dongiaceae bacterium]|nr:hypothetical protein [Dongiaceae bacterium]
SSLPRIALAVVLALAPCSSPAGAAVPSPAHNTFPQFVVASPDGALVTQVIMRDGADHPVVGDPITLLFSGCPQADTCSSGGVCAGCVPRGTPGSPLQITKLTDANGVAAFALRVGGGGCDDPPYVVIYDEFYFARVTFASLDQDGDMSVTPADLAHVHALLGTNDLRADFDGDQVVTTADEAILLAHMGAGCEGATPVRTRTWGELKSLYR